MMVNLLIFSLQDLFDNVFGAAKLPSMDTVRYVPLLITADFNRGPSRNVLHNLVRIAEILAPGEKLFCPTEDMMGTCNQVYGHSC
jgi:hypothetical protein